MWRMILYIPIITTRRRHIKEYLIQMIKSVRIQPIMDAKMVVMQPHF